MIYVKKNVDRKGKKASVSVQTYFNALPTRVIPLYIVVKIALFFLRSYNVIMYHLNKR